MSALPSLIFADVFRRADKADDGHLSRNELWDFFSVHETMDKYTFDSMMKEMDLDHNGYIDIEELIAYFSKGVDGFNNLFVSVEDLNSNVSLILQKLSTEYKSLKQPDQFRCRFYIRETANQLTAINRSLQESLQVLESMSNDEWNPPAAAPTFSNFNSGMEIESDDTNVPAPAYRSYIREIEMESVGATVGSVRSGGHQVAASVHSVSDSERITNLEREVQKLNEYLAALSLPVSSSDVPTRPSLKPRSGAVPTSIGAFSHDYLDESDSDDTDGEESYFSLDPEDIKRLLYAVTKLAQDGLITGDEKAALKDFVIRGAIPSRLRFALLRWKETGDASHLLLEMVEDENY